MARAPLPSGIRVLGRYAICDEIAKGGMASVHLGRLLGSAGFARTVAIKRLHERYARERDFVDMLIDEARLAARIRHPNVVPVLDVVTHAQEMFLVMEYIQGESLSRLLKASGGLPVPHRIAVTVVAGALYGLHAAHEAQTEHGEPLNIVHRDVSPQNIMVGTDGLARVTDFGIAKAAKRLHETRSGEVKGKLGYMAPEHVEGGDVDRRADVYSASVVLWESLTGRRLFSGGDAIEVINRIMAAQIPPPRELVPEIPEELDQVVLRGLSMQPRHRYATAREMATALERAVHGAPLGDVAEWVEHTAAESLARRAGLLAEMERASANISVPQHSTFDDAHDDTQRFLPGLAEAYGRSPSVDVPSTTATTGTDAPPATKREGRPELPGASELTLTTPFGPGTRPEHWSSSSIDSVPSDARYSGEHTPSIQMAIPASRPRSRTSFALIAIGAGAIMLSLVAVLFVVMKRVNASPASASPPASAVQAPALPPEGVEVAPLATEAPSATPEVSPEPVPSQEPSASAAPPPRVPAARPAAKRTKRVTSAAPKSGGDDDFGALLRK